MADLTPKDLNDLAKATNRLADAQGDLAKTSKKAAGGIDDVHDEAKRALSQVAKLEDQISALMKATKPLGGVLGKFNDQLERQIALSRQAAEALKEQAKAAELAGKAQAGPADSTEKEASNKGSSKGLTKDESKDLGKAGIEAIASLAKGGEPMEVLIDLGAEVAKMFQEAAVEGVGFSAELRRLGVSMGFVKAGTAEATVAGAELKAMNAGVAESAAAATAAEGAMLAPLILIGAAAAGAFALFEREVDKNTKHATSWADTWNASVTVIGKALTSGPIGAGLKALGDAFGKTLDWIVKGITGWYDNAVGYFVGAYVAVAKNWSRLPEVFGVIIVAAVQKIMSGLQFIIDGAINGLNFLLKKANMSTLGPFKLPPIVMPKSDIAKSVQEEMAKATAAAKQGRENLGKEIAKESDKEFKKRQKREKKAGGGSVGTPTIVATAPVEDAAAKLEEQRIQQMQAVNGFTDQTSRINVSLASTLEKRNEIEKTSLEARQKVEAEVLSNQLDKLVEDKKVSKEDSEARKKAQGELHKAQELQQDIAQRVAVQKEALTAAQAGRQNDIDLLTSKNALIRSVSAQADNEEQVRKLRYEIAVADQQAVIDRVKLGQGTKQEVYLAEKKITILTEIYENDKKIAERQHKLLNAYVQAIEAFNGMAKSVLEGDVGGTITGLSNTLSKASGLFKDAKIGGALGGAADFFGPVGSAVSAVTGVIGAIGQASAAKAQAKLEGLKKGVEDLRTADMASSNSIAGALEEANQNWNSDLEYSNEMLTALRSIDNQIGALAGSLSRSITAGKLMSTTNLALGKTGGGGLFGSSSNTELLDQGLAFNSATYGQVASGGLSGQTYADLATTKTSKFLGVVTGVKVKTSTVNGGLGDDLLAQVSGIIQALGDGVIKAATAFGPSVGEAAKAALGSAQIDIGKLSLKGLSSDEIEKLLNSTFSKVGDDLAAAGVPGLEKLADVGEGAFETLIRLAREYKVVDVTLASIGKKFGQLGLESLAARDALVEAVGGLDAFVSKTSFFAQNFLTEAERLKPSIDMVNEGLAAYGLSAESSRDAFKTLVLAQNLTTEAGQQTYATLMNLAPAFDKVATAAEAAKAAVDDKRTSIQDQIDDLTLSPAAKLVKSRNAEMEAVKALDISLVPLLKNLWGLQDAAEAAKLATDRSNMYADLLEAQGRTAEATQRRRALALAAIEDPIQQQYQTQIWAAQDAAEKVSAARDALSQAYENQKTIFQGTVDKFKALSESLKAFSASLSDTIAGTDLATRYRTTRDTFQTTAAKARLGDADAMGRLQTQGEAFTSASRDYATSTIDYLRDVALVRGAVDDAADTADRQVSIAEEQLAELENSVSGLININNSVISVEQAILNLQGALAEANSAGVVSVGGSSLGLSGASSSSGAPAVKTLDGKYAYDSFLGSLALIESRRDPQYYGGSNPALTPGTQSYSLLETYKARDQLSYLNQSLNFATGGGFEVGGSGPPDSKLFNLALSPGEAVNVRRRGEGGDESLINELRRLREEMADLRQTNARIANSNDKMERTLTNVTEGGRAMQTSQAAA